MGAVQGRYKQCLLRRGETQQVAWIEDGLAVPGKYVCIKDVDGWLVVCAWRRNTDEDAVTVDGRDHRSDFASLK